MILRFAAVLSFGVVAFLGITTFGVSTRSLSCDEALLWRLTQASSVDEFYFHVGGQLGPPFHYVALRLWLMVVDDHPVGFRSMSVLSYCATLLLSYLLARDVSRLGRSKLTVAPEMVGAVAVILAATAGSLLRWASDANVFSFACFLVMLRCSAFSGQSNSLFSRGGGGLFDDEEAWSAQVA